MSSAISTPARRRKSRNGTEFNYVPGTLGNIFSMDLGLDNTSGAMYFEPPRDSMQASIGYHVGGVDNLWARDLAPWVQDSLSNLYLPGSSVGNANCLQGGFEPMEANYISSSVGTNASLYRGASQNDILSISLRQHHSMGVVRSMNNDRASLPLAFDQPNLLFARNVPDWVDNSVNTTNLPPEVTIDPLFGVPPPNEFQVPSYPGEAELGQTETTITASGRREYYYHWGSNTSSSSEYNFLTPSSSLSTSDGLLELGTGSDCVDLPDHHQRSDLSKAASGFNGIEVDASLQRATFTSQSFSIDDWPASVNDQEGSSRSNFCLEIRNKTRNEVMDDRDTGDRLIGPVPSPYQNRHRTHPVVLPAPANYRSSAKAESLQDRLRTPDGPQISRRTCDRRTLSERGREEAKAVRVVGACLICRHLSKLKCDSILGKPCPGCEKILGHRAKLLETKDLVTGICIRVDLGNYRNEINDLYDVANRTYDIPIKPYDSRRTIVIGNSIRTGGKKCAYFPMDNTLSVDVQDCEFIGHGLGRKMRWEENSEKMSSYRIDDSSLPTPDELDAWGRNLMVEFTKQVKDFKPEARDKFLFDYCNVTPHLPFHTLVDLTIRMVSLSQWLHGSRPAVSPADLYMHGSPLFSMSDGSIEQMLSPISRGQLRSIAAKGMEDTEQEILKFFDVAIKEPPKDAIIIGLCIWRLALLYRTMMKRYKVILSDARIDRRREKQKVMYEAMTTGYSLVYRKSSSPYSPAWRIEDHLDTFGNNKVLANTFLQIKDADDRFYEEAVNDDDDVHARKLFWERMAKCQKRARDGERS